MATYEFLTDFALPTTPSAAYAAVRDPVPWLSRARYVRVARRVARGDDTGVGDRFQAAVRAPIGYRFTWDLETVEAEPDAWLAWRARGELAGRATWQLVARQGLTLGHVTWRVRPDKPWLELVDRIARPVLVWNHDRVMRAGVDALAARLGVEVVAYRTRARRTDLPD